MSDVNLSQLTVAQLQTELRSRGVKFSSKLRKSGLVNLLSDSWHLPADPQLQNQAPKQKTKTRKGKNWKSNEPVRRLLYFEFKEGNVPLDPHEMGPAEVYCKFHEAQEFVGVKYDDYFVQCLKSLREHVMKEEPLLKWNEFHPARDLLFNELAEGGITDEMGPAEVWCKYCDEAEFKLRGMKFNDTFKRRLAALRKLVRNDKGRANDDLNELRQALQSYPPPVTNHRGEPQWNGSKAQQLLQEAVERGDHMNLKPAELHRSKAEFRAFALNTFRWHIHQEVKTKKYLFTLVHDAEQKLRKHLGKSYVEK